MGEAIILALFIILILVGALGTLIPFVPGISFMFLSALVFSLITGFEFVTLGNLLILALIFLLSITNDWLAGILGAKWGGASKKALLYGLAGLVVGFVAFPPLGGIAGLFTGVLLAEMIKGKSSQSALKSATGSLIGVATGVIINVVLAVVFLALFLIFVFV